MLVFLEGTLKLMVLSTFFCDIYQPFVVGRRGSRLGRVHAVQYTTRHRCTEVALRSWESSLPLVSTRMWRSI